MQAQAEAASLKGTEAGTQACAGGEGDGSKGGCACETTYAGLYRCTTNLPGRYQLRQRHSRWCSAAKYEGEIEEVALLTQLHMEAWTERL